jgi:hypothetical protein
MGKQQTSVNVHFAKTAAYLHTYAFGENMRSFRPYPHKNTPSYIEVCIVVCVVVCIVGVISTLGEAWPKGGPVDGYRVSSRICSRKFTLDIVCALLVLL